MAYYLGHFKISTIAIKTILTIRQQLQTPLTVTCVQTVQTTGESNSEHECTISPVHVLLNHGYSDSDNHYDRIINTCVDNGQRTTARCRRLMPPHRLPSGVYSSVSAVCTLHVITHLDDRNPRSLSAANHECRTGK